MGIKKSDSERGKPSVRIFRGWHRFGHLVILQAKPEEYETHFIDSKTEPCLDKDCKHCPAPTRYRAYCGGWLYHAFTDEPSDRKPWWENVLIEFTESPMWQDLEFGERIYKVTKPEGSFNKPKFQLTEHCKDDDKLAVPPPVHVLAALCRVWGISLAAVADKDGIHYDAIPPSTPIIRLPRKD